MLRSSLSKFFATCVVIALVSAAGARAAVMSSCGIARIDGVLSPGEWASAAVVPLNVATASGTVAGKLYVMNDNLNLYLAVSFPASTLASADVLAFEFDNDNDGVWPEAGDDALVYSSPLGAGAFYDGYRTSLPPCPPGIGLCGMSDADTGGVIHGQGVLHNDGVNTVYEMSHELNSGETDKDFALVGGSTVGFRMTLQVDTAGTIYETHIPVAGNFEQLTIASCRPPLLSGCGTATIDAVINPLEWSGAQTYDMTVRTPHGGTTPARLYVMNDAFNLYFAFRFERAAADLGNSLDIEFDNSNNGVVDNGDDVILVNPDIGFVDDVRTNVPPCSPGAGAGSCGFRDTDLGGTNDGAGAFHNDGTYSIYEMQHPLNSGDANDFALSAFGGTTVGYFLFLRTINGPSFPFDFGDTGVPGFFDYAQIKLCEPAPGTGVAQLSTAVSQLTSTLPDKSISELQKPLASAQQNILAGKKKQAANDLDKFTKDVKKFIAKGSLPSRNGQQLISVAQGIMRAM